jgi:hypothetical protein
VNAKKPPLVAWKLVTTLNMKGGLGVLNLNLYNDVLLMKQLHKKIPKRICHGSNCFGTNITEMVSSPRKLIKGHFGGRVSPSI